MADKHFIYQGKDEETNFLIYFRDNPKTGRRYYHLLEEIPEEYLKSEAQFNKFKRFVEKYNQEQNKKAKIVFLTDKKGKKHAFLDEQCLAVEALYHVMKTQKDILPVFSAAANIVQENKKIKAEQQRLEELQREQNGGAVASQNHYKKPSKAQVVFTRALVTGMAVLLLLGAGGILNKTVEGSGFVTESTPSGLVQTDKPETSGNKGNITIAPSTSISPLPPETPMEPQDKPYIDYDLLTYDTYDNGSGWTMIEVSDALEIADACYSNIIRELKEYNEESPDYADYSFDYTKFNAAMFVGEEIRESSLREYVPLGGNIKNAADYDALCRGSHKIGPDAIKEANEVSRKLTGEDVIRSEEDLYDLVRATRACMYIAIKNYEYCAGVISAEDVNPNMVFDAYLWGCGNVRKWLRECVENGEYNGGYKPKDYSIDILYYADCLEEYWEKILANITDGSHDRHWQDLHVNGLWKVDEYRESVKGSEPGQ